MRLMRYGESAFLVELPDLSDVVGFAGALRTRDVPGLVDIVPAARTVLVTFDASVDADAVAATLSALSYEPQLVGVGQLVEIPMTYDGPDLAAVAALVGLSVSEVRDRHSGVEYVVAFCGFMPGFAYCAGTDPVLRVPRRATPRASVPAGSVALADAWTGVYPRSSPGGWQLIGRTDAVLWDPRREPPALLGPGTRVRFVEQRS